VTSQSIGRSCDAACSGTSHAAKPIPIAIGVAFAAAMAASVRS
jgi:hypothetical protein